MRITNPVMVNPALLDASYVCYCPEHRSNMRKTIYGKERLGMPKRNGNKESCFHSMPYAGETPPEWKSTFVQDYGRKQLENDHNISAQAAMDANKAHFSLALSSHGQNDGQKQLSTTKRDYVAKELTNESGYSKAHFESSYPPIFLDKEAMKTPSDSVYRSQYTAIDPRSAKPSFRMDRTVAMKTNINLGNDQNPDQYISVTHAHIKPLPQIEPVAMIRTDRKKSNVLENPDGEVGGYESTQKSDYSFNKDIDRKSLIVDNKAFMKDLKMTHFQLGADNVWSGASQYSTTYRTHPLPHKAEKLRHSDTDDVDLRDDQNGKTESSTNKRDYIWHQLPTVHSIEAGITKAFNNHASVSLKSRNEYETPSSSVTRSDYIRHAVLQPSDGNMIPLERETAIMFDEGYPCEKHSTAQADYLQHPRLPGEGLHRVSKQECVALRSDSHFSFGSNPTLRETTTNAHYGTTPDPSAYSYPRRIPLRSPREISKPEIVDAEAHITTSRQDYKNFGIHPTASIPVRLHGHPAGFHLGNGETDTRQMITANQRTYLPPEMLKFSGSMPLACPVCIKVGSEQIRS